MTTEVEAEGMKKDRWRSGGRDLEFWMASGVRSSTSSTRQVDRGRVQGWLVASRAGHCFRHQFNLDFALQGSQIVCAWALSALPDASTVLLNIQPRGKLPTRYIIAKKKRVNPWC